MANDPLNNSAFSLEGGNYGLEGNFSLEPTQSQPLQPFEFAPGPKKYGPADIVSYFGKGVATGAKSTVKNWMTVARANAIEANAGDLASVLQYYEDKLQGAIEGGFGAPDEGANFAEHPVMATAYNVGAGAPLMAGAMAATALTRNPMMPIAIFAIPSFGNFYDQATANGVKHEEAMKLAMANMVLTGASVAVPMGQFAKAAKQVNMFKHAATSAATSVVGKAVKSGAFKTAQQAALLGAEMGTFNAAQATGEGVLRYVGWNDPHIVSAVGESMAAGFITGAVMGGAVQHVVNQAKSNFIKDRVEAIKAEHPEYTPQDIQAKTKQAADKFDELSEVISRDPVEFLNKFNEAIGLPVTLTSLSGAKGSTVQVEKILLGNDKDMRDGLDVINPLIKNMKDVPLTYTHYLLREAINNRRDGKTVKEARLAVKKFQENTLDTYFNLFVLGATHRTWSPDTEVWVGALHKKVTIAELSRTLKDARNKPGGSILPDELTYFSHGLLDKTGSFIENSVASAKVEAILRGEYDRDPQIAEKTDEEGNKTTFKRGSEGYVPDVVSRPEPQGAATAAEFSKWKDGVDGKDMTEVLQTIKGEEYTPLAEAMIAYLKRAGIEYQVLFQAEDISAGKLKARGRTNPKDGTVNIYHDALVDKNSTREAAGVILHEAVHVSTVDVLQNYLSDKTRNTDGQNAAAKKIVDLYEETLAQLPDESQKAIKAIRDGKSPTENDYNNHYGFVNVHEFVAQGFTNKAFQEKLNNTFVDGGKSTAWQSFKKAVVDIIKSIAEAAGITIKNDSVLTKLVDNVYGLLEEGGDISVKAKDAPSLQDIAPQRVAFIGSRTFADSKLIDEQVSRLPRGSTVVSGGARGADILSETSAKKHGLATKIFKPDWSKGRGAGFARNSDIINNADRIIAFWDGVSRGTKDSINKAVSSGKPVLIVYPDGRTEERGSKPGSVPAIIAQTDEIKAGIEQSQAEQQKIADEMALEHAHDIVRMNKALENYEDGMGIKDRRDKKETWGKMYRKVERNEELPSVKAEQAAYEDARADMAKEALFVVDEDGDLESVDLSSITETGEQLAPTAPDTLVSNIGDHYRDFISQIESLFLESQRSQPVKQRFSRLGQEAEATAIRKGAARYAAMAWFNDLLKSGVEGSTEGIDASLTRLRKIREIEAQLQKQEYEKSRELQASKNDMDVARTVKKWDGPINRTKNNINMLRKAWSPDLNANAVLARNMFLEYQKSVDNLLKEHGLSAEFLYENPDILSNQELFMKKVRDLAEERVVPQRKPTTKEEELTRRAQLKEPVFGRVDLPAPYGDGGLLPAGMYKITFEGEHYTFENSTTKKTLSTGEMIEATDSISFKIDEGDAVTYEDLLMPSLSKPLRTPPKIAGQPEAKTSVVDVVDKLIVNSHFDNFKNWMYDTLGKARSTKKPKMQDLIDTIVMPMWELKNEGSNWGSLANAIMQPQDGLMSKIIEEIAPHSALAKAGTLRGRDLEREVRKYIASAMTRSHEEIGVAGFDGDKSLIGSTMMGIGYPWESVEQKATEMRAVSAFCDAMGIDKAPFLKELEKGRPRRLWSSLIDQADQRLFKLLVYNKAHVEYPLVMAGIDVGLFTSHAMAAWILSGYVHRVWEEGEEQQLDGGGKGYKQTGGGKSARAPRRYSEEKSYSDWHEKVTMQSRLTAYDDYMAISKDYVKEYGMLVAQHTYLNKMKELKTPDPEKIADLIIAECAKKPESYTVPDKADLIKEVRMLGIIDYQDSPHVRNISAMTGHGQKGKVGFDTGGIFSILEMKQSHEAPGFAKFIGKGFEAPFVVKPVLELMDSVFDSRLGTASPFFSAVNNFLSYYKRGVSINPFDSPLLFITTALVNTNPVFWIPDIFWPYAQVLGRASVTAFTDVGKLIQNKKLDSTKMWEPTALLDTAEERAIWTSLRKHGLGHLSNIANAMSAIYVKSDIGKFDSTITRKEEGIELATSGLGINNEVFKRFIIPSLIKVAIKKVQMLEKQGFSREDAARIAASHVSRTAGLFSPHLFGAEGDLLNILWFARGLTTGFISQVTGAAYAPMKKFAPGLARSIYKTHTGKFSRNFNPFVHAELSPKLMDKASIMYMQHLGKVFGLGLMSYAAVQYVLSFGDDDKLDEHGQRAKGDPMAKKRWIWNNEPGRRGSIRTSDKDENQRRIFINPQFIREFRQLVDITGNFGSESMPEGVLKWHKNRLNSFGELMIAAFTGVDVGLGEKIIKDDKLPYLMKGEIMAKYTLASLTPFGFGKEDMLPVAPENPTASKIFNTVKFFGVSTTKGQRMEEGVTAGQLEQAREAIAIKAYYDQEMRDEMQGKSPAEKIRLIRSKYSGLTKGQINALVFGGRNPASKIIRGGAKAARQNESRK